MKGGLVAAATAIVEVVKSGAVLQGDIVFTAVAGEETDSSGAMRFVDQYRRDLAGKLAGVVICEPTKFDVVTAHRGILWLQITTAGKTAHGSMPHLGINAILKMNRLLNRLEGFQIPHTPHPLLGGCSMSVNRIDGGKATNVIPDRCTIEVDVRTLPGMDHETVTGEFQKLFEAIKADDPQFKARTSVLRSSPALETDPAAPFVRSVLEITGIEKTATVGFTTDGPHFVPLNAPIIIYGPGDPAICHQPDEYIEIAAVEEARLHYRRIIERFLT
jgi:succinyl-diaminopimelate desuccinylase